MRGIYAIYDTKAEDILGPIINVKHEAVATRMFMDGIFQKDSQLAAHADDYELIRLGFLHDDGRTLVPDSATVVTARALVAAHQPQETNGPPNVEIRSAR